MNGAVEVAKRKVKKVFRRWWSPIRIGMRCFHLPFMCTAPQSEPQQESPHVGIWNAGGDAFRSENPIQ